MSSVGEKRKAKKYVLVKYYHGEPKESDFEIVEEDLPEVKDGEIMVEALYYSIDPYMRAHMQLHKLPIDMIGRQLAKIMASRHDSYPVGCHIVASLGWRTHTVFKPEIPFQPESLPVVRVPDISPHPLSLSLGMLDMPGNTAHFGITESLKPKAGEIVVITGAAGAVGSHAGQIAKILGCTVIGFAGTDEKCKYLINELGFDHAFNYKTVDVPTVLGEAAPTGVDCYFDNVGGEISYKIMRQMKQQGRITVCGSISSYNATEPAKVTIMQPIIAFKELKIEGFLVFRWENRWLEGMNKTLAWINEGKLKYREDVHYGFENMVKILNSQLRGENIGKVIVKVNQ